MKKLVITFSVIAAILVLLFGLWYFLWTPENLASMGERAAAKENWRSAMRYYESAASMEPENEQYALRLAELCVETQNYTRAERALVTALRNGPKKELYLALSRAYVAQDKLLDAQQLLDGISEGTLRDELEAMRPATPTPSHEAGTYSEYIEVSFAASNGTIYYSLDEQYPSLSGLIYETPLALPAGDSRVSAIAVSDNGLVSHYVQAEYRIVGVVEEVTFNSPEMDALVRELLVKADTTKILTSDLWKLKELTVPGELTDYSDLRWFTALESLTIHDSSAEDYSFLTELTSLKTLDLTGCLISSEALDAIGTLTGLQTLRLGGCGISNALALAPLTELRELDLSDNSLTNIGVVSNFTQLQQLKLNHNALTSLEALSGLTELVSIEAQGNQIASLTPLSQCTKLEHIDMSSNRLTSLSGLSDMTSLRELLVSGNSINTLSPVRNCIRMVNLEIANNELSNIDEVLNMHNLTHLDISHNSVEQIPAFTQEDALTMFYASYNEIDDVSPLAKLVDLTYVDVDYNENVEDVECLKDCNRLVQVNAFGTQVTSAGSLVELGVIVNYSTVLVEE